tara:strand:+ start:19889 stop:21649 length:1761 start_codon:yes stop_codon:yes gene_type:complete
MKKTLITTAALLAITSFAHAADLHKFVNQSPYYIFAKSSGSFFSDPTGQSSINDIKPGDTAYVTNGYVGSITCSGPDYSQSQQSCMEQANQKPQGTLTQGGYGTYMGLSAGSCSIADGVHWSCQWDKASGDFTMSYKSVTDPDAKQDFDNVLNDHIANYADLPFRGINLSALEYDGTYLDALFQLPGLPEMVYFANEGMNTVRLPIRSEFWLSNADKPTESTYANFNTAIANKTYIAAVHDTVEKYLSQGLTVILDLHNYMRFCDTGADYGQTNEPTNDGSIANAPVCHVMNKNDLSKIWSSIMTAKDDDANDKSFAELAAQYPQHLVFGIMNEPYASTNVPNQKMATETVFENEIAAANVIRAQAHSNLIIFSGNYWDPMHGWVHGTDDTKAMGLSGNGDTYDKNISQINAIGNTAVEVHQYLDSNFSGLHDECNTYASYDDFVNDNQLQLNTFADWMTKDKVKVFLSEFGATSNPTCETDLHYLMKFVNEHKTNLQEDKGGFVGWTVWRANRNLAPGAAFGSNNAVQSALDGTFYKAIGTPIKTGAANPLMGSLYCKKADGDDYGYLTPVSMPSSQLPTDCQGY